MTNLRMVTALRSPTETPSRDGRDVISERELQHFKRIC